VSASNCSNYSESSRGDVACRFSRFGELVAIHYPTGFTIGRDHLSALTEALRIKRWHMQKRAA